MNSPLITLTMSTPGTPTVATATSTTTSAITPAATENAATSAFQPVLAALQQGAAESVQVPVQMSLPSTAEVATLPLPTGNELPAGGEPLPLPVIAMAATDAEAATLAADDPEGIGEPVPVIDEHSPAPDTEALAIDSEPAQSEVALFAAADSNAPPVVPAARSARGDAIATPTEPASGTVKRLLPASTDRHSTQSRADTASTPLADAGGARPGATQAQAPVVGRADVDPSMSLEGVDAAEPVATTSVAAPPRDHSLRAYQGTAPATAQVEVPVGRPGWNEAVLEKVMWFSAQRIGSAEIHLNPAELGPLSVRISTHQEQASIYFSSHHASVRDALDQALPRLREMFDSQGIQLLDAGVGEQRHARQQADGRGEGGSQVASGGDDGGGGERGAEGAALTVRVSNQLVDAYA